MDDAKKQKMLLGFLVVLIIGAGSFFFLGRDTGSKNSVANNQPAQRRERKEEPVAKKETERREARPEKEVVKRDLERRQREDFDNDKPERRDRKREDSGKKVEKKKIMPAA